MPKLIYFDVYARAEPIRVMLNYAKIAFEDVRLTGAEYKELKTTGAVVSQLPVWVTDDGKKYNQSHAILRALGIEYGFYGSTFDERWASDMVLDTFEDLSGAGYMKSWWSPKPSEEDVNNLLTGTAKAYGIFEQHLATHPDWKYIAGNKPSIGDFKIVASVW